MPKMAGECVPEYKVTRAITQSISEAMVHADSDDLWEVAAHTMDGMVRLPPAMRLKIFDDLLVMVMEAKRKDEEKVSEL